MAMRVPEPLNFTQAAAIPEAFLTAYQTLFTIGNIKSGQDVLIHAAARSFLLQQFLCDRSDINV